MYEGRLFISAPSFYLFVVVLLHRGISRNKAEGCRRLGAAKKKLRPGHLVNALPCSLRTRGLITFGCIGQAVLLRSLSTEFCY